MNAMNPREFAKTIYLGDRQCLGVCLDGGAQEVKIAVDLISRVRGDLWNFYSDEDIVNGYLVFENADLVVFNPPGPIPNDWIVLESIGFEQSGGKYVFIFSVGALLPGESRVAEVKIEIRATSLCLEDSSGARIRT